MSIYTTHVDTSVHTYMLMHTYTIKCVYIHTQDYVSLSEHVLQMVYVRMWGLTCICACDHMLVLET